MMGISVRKGKKQLFLFFRALACAVVKNECAVCALAFFR